MPVYLFLP